MNVKAAPRRNDLATSFVYFYCTGYHLGLQAPQANTRDWRGSLLGRSSVKKTTAAIRFILDTISTFR